jgi:hypothetical protein
MIYARIVPALRAFELIQTKDWDSAIRAAGLTPAQVDHGGAQLGLCKIGVVVGEYGLFTPPETTAYFGINRNLYAGNALVYAVDHRGETIDFDLMDELRAAVMWLPDRPAVELAIRTGVIRRPMITADGKLVWTWPGPDPFNREVKA